jgi:hypothetical protein
LLLTTALLGLVGIALLGLWLFGKSDLSQGFMVTGWGMLAAIAVAITLIFPSVREHVSRSSIGLLGLVLWIPAWFHLLVIDRLFLKVGSLDRVLPK